MGYSSKYLYKATEKPDNLSHAGNELQRLGDDKLSQRGNVAENLLYEENLK